MFLHHSLSGVMVKPFFKIIKLTFPRRPYTSHFTAEVTAECLLLATTAVKDSFDNWAGGSSLRVVFEVDTDQSLQNTILDTRI